MWSDRDLLAKMLQAEAGNQGVTGMLAVGSVIDNRRRANGYGGNSWRDVMLAPGQFSPANSITGYAGGEQGVDLNALQPSDTAYMVADQILSGKYQDPTGGALNFLNPDISQPSWLSTMGNTVKIGDHLFGTAGSGEGVTGRPSRVSQAREVSAPQGVLSTQSEEPDVQNQMATGLFGALFPNMTADRQDRIAMALSGLSMNPNMGAMQMVRDRMDQRTSDRKEAKAQQAQQAQQNRTIEWLAKTYGPEAAAAFEAAGNAGLQMWQKGQQGPEQTALMQNVQYIMQNNPGMSFEDALQMARSGTTVNVNGQAPQPEKGYRNVFDESGRLIAQEPIPGSPAAQELEAAEIAAQQAGQTQAENDAIENDVVMQQIKGIRGLLRQDGIFDAPEAGVLGNILRLFGNQEATDYANRLTTLQGVVAFDQLQKMREASPTGGALGAISERELATLSAQLGSLEPNSSPALIEETLNTLERVMRKAYAYPNAAQFGFGGGVPAPGQINSSQLPPSGAPVDDEALFKKYGIGAY